MASIKTVWGIDIGQCAMKTLKLSNVDGQIRVEAFEIVEHPRVLTQSEGDRERLVREALEQFLERNDLTGSTIAVSVPGQSGFTRFVKLPPVEEKQVPEIVRFEAEQQIPFNIDEVIWRWQAFRDPDSPDIEVGIFAMKKSDVWEVLGRFNEIGVAVDVVQMAPLALYNFMNFDGQTAEDGATMLVDVGADKTDLVVADGARIWMRTLQIGGNNFTEVLMNSFKLSFPKAEKLKRTAVTSKYARQIFQAMRPVFSELVQEVQRSIGYYSSLHKDSRFQRVVGIGNGFRLPGLQKYLEQNLGIPVARLDEYGKISPSEAINTPAFTENALSFATAYGLALQGLGLTRIQTNLLPSESARRRRWAGKRPWFAAAGVLVLATLLLIYGRTRGDGRFLDPDASGRRANAGMQVAKNVVAKYERLQREYGKIKNLDKVEKKNIDRYRQMLGYRPFWPTLQSLLSESVRGVAADQELMNMKGRERLMQIERSRRRVVFVDSVTAQYEEDLAGLKDEDLKAKFRGGRGGRGGGRSAGRGMGEGDSGRMPGMMEERGAGPRPFERERGGGRGARRSRGAKTGIKPGGKRGFLVYMEGSTPRRGEDAVLFISSLKNKMKELAKRYPSLEVTASFVVDRKFGREVSDSASPGRTRGMEERERGARGGERATGGVDPLTGEATDSDTSFVLGWAVAINGDGLSKDDPQTEGGKAGGVR